MSQVVTFEEVLERARQLPAADQARLIEQLAITIKRELATARPIPRQSLRGLWQGLR